MGEGEEGGCRAERFLRAVASFVGQKSLYLAAAWLLLVASAMVGYSRQALPWVDEILGRWICTLPTARDIWSALGTGIHADPLPLALLMHWLTVAFGPGALALRLPSIVGICAMLLFLFLTLRRHVPPLYALLALILPFCTTLPTYGFRGRPYGLLWGCLTGAIYCWDKAGDRSSVGWNVAFGLALAAAQGCHFYAVFALPAFCLAEGVRSLERRRLSWATVAALTAASATELLYLPFMSNLHRFLSPVPRLDVPHLGSVPRMLVNNLNGLAIPLFACLLLAAACATLGLRLTPEPRGEGNTRTRGLAALGLGFLLIPWIGWGVELFALKVFEDRFVLHGLLGVFLLVPMLAAWWSRSDRLLGLALVTACALPAFITLERGIAGDFKAPAQYADFALLEHALPQMEGDVVVPDMFLFAEMVDYSPALKAKCIYLTDAEKELEYTGSEKLSLIFPKWAVITGLRTTKWRDYPYRDVGFLFLTLPDREPDSSVEWLRPYLRASGRYGGTLMSLGRYVIVHAKAVDPSSAAALTVAKRPELQPRHP
jgi:hypothetical protein